MDDPEPSILDDLDPDILGAPAELGKAVHRPRSSSTSAASSSSSSSTESEEEESDERPLPPRPHVEEASSDSESESDSEEEKDDGVSSSDSSSSDSESGDDSSSSSSEEEAVARRHSHRRKRLGTEVAAVCVRATRHLYVGENAGGPSLSSMLSGLGVGRQAQDAVHGAAKGQTVHTTPEGLAAKVKGLLEGAGGNVTQGAFAQIEGLFAKLAPGGSIDVPKRAMDALNSQTAAAIKSAAGSTIKDMAATAAKVIPELLAFGFQIFGQAFSVIIAELLPILIKSLVHAITVGYPGDIDAVMRARFGDNGPTLLELANHVAWVVAADEMAHGACMLGSDAEAPDFERMFAKELEHVQQTEHGDTYEQRMANHGFRVLKHAYTAGPAGERGDRAADIAYDAALHAAGASTALGDSVIASMREAAVDLGKAGRPKTIRDVTQTLGETSELLEEVEPYVNQRAGSGKAGDRMLAQMIAMVASVVAALAKTVSKGVIALLRNPEFRNSVSGMATAAGRGVVEVGDYAGESLVKQATADAEKKRAQMMAIPGVEAQELLQKFKEMHQPKQAGPARESGGTEIDLPGDIWDAYVLGRATARALHTHDVPWVMYYQMLCLVMVLADLDKLHRRESDQTVSALIVMSCASRVPTRARLGDYELKGGMIAMALRRAPGHNKLLYQQAVNGQEAGVLAFLFGLAAQSGASAWIKGSPYLGELRK